MLKHLSILCLIALIKVSKVIGDSCVNMWDADLSVSNINICPVFTNSGEQCKFPFTFNGVEYKTCIINNDYNTDNYPECYSDATKKWNNCIVPTDAIVNQVTTRKAGYWWNNGASLNGGTMVFITGKRFAANLFSISPTASTSNQVVLVSDFASFDCEIHPDKATTTQITCYTSAMPAGSYFVKVIVNGNLIPTYQYYAKERNYVTVADINTPKISSLDPEIALPQSMLNIYGDIKAFCYTRDDTTNDDYINCADDSQPRILRVYLGGQGCEMLDPTTNTLYINNTFTSLGCKLQKAEVSYYNATILVNNEYGRSLAASNTFYVSPNDNLYNFQTYAEIDSVSPQIGSTVGGNVTITGKYFYSDINVPAKIEIGGQPCKLISFNMNNLPNTTFICQNTPYQQVNTEFYGNRGINLIRDNIFTAYSDFANAVPSQTAEKSVVYKTVYQDTRTVDVTIWFKGFFNPKKDSLYEFNINTNGQAQLFISTDSISANKVSIANNSTKGSVQLKANNNYFFLLVASKQSGGLNISVNATMLQTGLTDQMSAFVFNEIQEIEITSTMVLESYSISFANIVTASGQAEIQNVEIQSLDPSLDSFRLQYEGVTTALISVGASALDVQKALNDLPNLSPNLVTVTQNSSTIYSVLFNADLGDVSLLQEVSSNVNSSITEKTQGIPTGNKVQINIENKPTGLFRLNDTKTNITTAVLDSFGIKCPSSILTSTDTIFSYDYEPCNWGNNLLNETAFCGKCSKKNTNNLFWNKNSTLDYKYICFAYKLTNQPFTLIYYQIIDPVTGDLVSLSIKAQSIADKKWHYNCFDLSAGLQTSSASYSKYSLLSIRLYQAWFSPGVNDMYIDTLSVRKTPPLGYDDVLLSFSRRLYPSLQIIPGKLDVSVSTALSTITVSYRPANCSCNLTAIEIKQNLSGITINKITSGSPPVTGLFNLTYNNNSLDVPSDVSENDLRNLLQSQKDFGNIQVTRSNDCAGYKWRLKWLSGGDKSKLIISSNTLTGNNPNIKTTTIQNGGAVFAPIKEDLLRTYHTKPQITVSINDLNSRCTNSCDFEWSSASTPIVDSINTSPLNAISISGSGFSTVAQNNQVLIGDIPCAITSATATQLVCSAGENPVGTYNFTVSVLDKGLAKMNANPSIIFQLTASSLSPSSSGTGGGSTLSIIGVGFNSKCSVTVDNNICSIVSISYSLIKCILPANPTSINKSVDVVVIEESVQSSPLSFFYDATNTPTVTSITPNILNVLGNQSITISGTGLPTSSPNVFIGKQRVKVISSSNTQLVVLSVGLAPGLYDLTIPVDNMGNTKVNTKIEYVLYVSSITPNVISVRGGALSTVYGDGFSTNCSLNKVAFGTQTCKVLSCSSNWIKCQTSSAYVSHNIDNSAADPYHGNGYAWSNSYITINIGDTVKWTWKPPTGISSVKYQVAQVQDPNSETSSGFTSGDPTPTGTYSFQFNQAGTYYYWSGFVESTQQIWFRGVVNVKDSVDKELEVNVALNGFQAQKCSFPFVYNSVSYSSCTSVDFNFNWCSSSSTYSGQTLKCDPLAQAPADVCPGSSISGVTAPSSIYKVLFIVADNQLPTVNYVSVDNITSESQITVQGTGFSSTSCQNQVIIGGVNCPISTSSTTEIICKLSDDSGLYPNIPHLVEVLVNNIGFALQNGTFLINLQPVIKSISKTTGSVAGGTLLTIMGSGFIPKSTAVQIGNNQYFNNDNQQTVITYNSIVLNTLLNSGGDFEIIITSNAIKAVCSTNCNFNYSQAITPTISAVTPNTITSSGSITLTGTNFNDNSTNVKITIGKQNCVVNSVINTQITCQLNGLNIGVQMININIFGVGDAQNDQILTVTGSPSIASITPSSGSIYGGTILTIIGNGFDETTKVLLHTVPCSVITRTINTISCITGSHTAGVVSFAINTNNVTYATSGLSFTYDATLNPTISSISPTHGSSGTLTINGLSFGSDSSKISVKVGSQICSGPNIQVTDTQITCHLNDNSAGVFPVIVQLNNQGYSNNDIKFTYDLSIASLTKTQGSIGGSLSLTINGEGFSSNSKVTICGNNCSVTATSVTSLTCVVPPATVKNADTNCQLNVTENELTATSSFDYLLSLTPMLSTVSPLRGGTGGGTILTITGTNFPTDPTKLSVTIAGTQCDVSSSSTTQINCRTNSYAKSSIKALVQVFIQDAGIALNNGTVQFEYIDLWSSRWTWGGLEPPGEGELAVIDRNQHIYFDTTTPVLKGILIQGGSLIFDDNQDVDLNAEYIIITEGGKFQVGTKEKPFLHNAIITMHGTVRSLELPIFGSKVIGLRNGTIDIHGAPVGVTWTHLGATASSGSNTITLKEPVDWIIGSTIIIATTGDKYTPGQSEQRIITYKTIDKKTLTLNIPLDFTHLSEKRTVGSGSRKRDIYIQCEVGLLSRNVLFRGSVDNSWAPLLSAPACPDGFDPDEFATQTCFLGRYGPELGTDQIGATIMISGVMREPGQPESVIARLSNVEFFHVGQAYRLGRYPIHFHMNGDMPSSYVSECAIHESFNRATNIHASNYLTIERNVIYNIMGGAYFLEDGIEIGNVFQYNLAIFVKTSSSLLNEDSTPAAFWATNANNTYVHNSVAGCTHFGWWYRILEFPDGPSYTPNYCPRRIPMGYFFNNTVHSTGRFGIWVFPHYFPTITGSCWDDRPVVAKFYNFTSYFNDKGAEYVESNTIQFVNFTVWDHYSIGIEAKTLYFNQQPNTYYSKTFFDEKICGLVSNSIIIGNSKNSPTKRTTPDGLVVPWDRGQLVRNIEFYNFPYAGSRAIRAPIIVCRCS